MNCKYCGAQIKENEKYCSSCGMQIENDIAQPIQIPVYYNQNNIDSTKSSYDTLAIVSMILSIVGLLCCGAFMAIPGLITGILGLKSQKNKGFAISGIVIGSLVILFTIIIVIFSLKYSAEFYSQFWDSDFYKEFTEFGEFNT